MPLRTSTSVRILGLAAALLLAACESTPSDSPGQPGGNDSGSPSNEGGGPKPSGDSGVDPVDIPPGEVVPGDDADDFVSHVPGQSGPGGGGTAGGASGSADAGAGAPTTDSSGGGAQRAIAEADILQRDGDKLYALSRYAGLTVIDISNPKDLKLLGNHRTNAEPFEMYLQNGVAYIMYNNYGRYTFDEAASSYVYRSTSQVSALNVSDPANIRSIGDEDVPGSISDSRLVGNVLYLVTFENGYCWDCSTKPNTRVVSFDVSDPAHFEKIDELRFEDEQPGGWQRSIAVNTQRIYVGGPNWSDRDSNIQVVDIADPAGDLKLGATVPLHGSVANRWQMDEYQGVLRVISQPTAWRTNDPPYVQTFKVESSDKVTKLASLAVRLPRPEMLQSVRFDGTRAYAVTFERTDPLFTFDLTDPAQPKQLGELEIPGWVYHMEPRGNRIYALGFDNMNTAGSLHVSIFDVENMSAPSMLSRVNFGGSWSNVAEDQDRIHKAFNILLDQGLILVPFSGGKYDQNNCNYTYLSGIQLIDVAADKLTLRGVAPQVGSARRSFIHRDHLFGITDNALSVFDISNRDKPAAVDQLEVARNIAQIRVMGDKLLRFGTDWWTNRSMVDFTSLDAPSIAEPVGELDLASVLDEEADNECQSGAHWEGHLYVHGDVAYAPRRHYRYSNTNGVYKNEQTLTLYIIDLRDRSAPKLAGKLSTAADPNGFVGGVVITDRALLIGRGTGYYAYYPSGSGAQTPKYAYDIYDLADPLAPKFTKRFEVPSQLAGGGWGYGFVGCGMGMPWGFWFPGYGSTSALVSGDLVVSQHEEAVGDGTGRVRYYLDRLDVSDPADPKLLTKINIPGQVVHFDGALQRLVTLEYTYTETKGLNWQQCYEQGSQSYLDSSMQFCRTYRRRANALVLENDKARRVSLVDLDTTDRNSGSIAISEQRMFVSTHNKQAWNSRQPPEQRIETFAFSPEGQLVRLKPIDVDDGSYWGQLYAREARAFTSSSGRLTVIDTRGDEPTLKHHDMQGWGCNSLEVHGDRAYCALDQYGVVGIDL